MIKNNYEIAIDYFYGKNGYKRDYSKAVAIFKKLSDQDHKHAASMLGLCYLKGHGV